MVQATLDPDGTIESYSWTQTAGPSVTLSGADSATPTFTAPDVGADGDTLTFELTVTDNDGATSTDTVNIVVYNVNLPPIVVNKPPVAVAGDDFSVDENTTGVTLDGTGSSILTEAYYPTYGNKPTDPQ